MKVILQILPKIGCLREINKDEKKKKEINASKIYWPIGKFAERAKKGNARRNVKEGTSLTFCNFRCCIYIFLAHEQKSESL